MLDYFAEKDKTLCCGCRACEQICTFNAIMMEKDNEGFLYPVINIELCTDCGLCKRACPINNASNSKKSEFEKPKVFAAWANDEKIRIDSSSGGLFTVVAEHIIKNNGVVYGAAFDNNNKVIYKSATIYSEIEPLRVSKYVQSDPLKCFQEIKEYLKTDKKVFFVGTPCYVAGLKAFLQTDYKNLLTSDFICEGVPSPKLFDKYINYLKKRYKGKIENFRFRDKSDWGGQRPSTSFTVMKKSGKTVKKIIPFSLASYYYGFLKYRTHRPSCYECQFRTVNRLSDLTLADYWGVERFHKDMDFNKGVSALIVHTQKGINIINEIGDKISKIDSTIENVIKHNANMNKKSNKPVVRDELYRNIDRLDYQTLKKRYLRPDNYYRTIFEHIIIRFKSKIKKILRGKTAV